MLSFTHADRLHLTFCLIISKIDGIEVKTAAASDSSSRTRHRKSGDQGGGGGGCGGGGESSWAAKSTAVQEFFAAVGHALKGDPGKGGGGSFNRLSTLEITGCHLTASNLDALGAGLALSASVKKVTLRGVTGLSAASTSSSTKRRGSSSNKDLGGGLNPSSSSSSSSVVSRKSSDRRSNKNNINNSTPATGSAAAVAAASSEGAGKGAASYGNIWRLTRGLAASGVQVLSLVECDLRPGEDVAAILSMLRQHQRRRDEVRFVRRI